MLVRSRHCGEQRVIGDDIVITIIGVQGTKVRIGVDAPKSVRVDRKEVHDRRVAEFNKQASGYQIDVECPVG